MNTNSQSKVIYIVGSSRSGSTILNILLGNIDGVFAAGELNHYMRAGANSDSYCSCGRPVTTCEFWTSVRNASDDMTKDHTHSFQDLTNTIENWRSLLSTNNKSSGNRLKQAYADYSDAYYDSILKISKNNFVVDASKSPVRLLHLLSNSNHEYKVIHTVRDPRGVCASLNKSWKKDVERGIEVNLAGRPYRKIIKELYLLSFLTILARLRTRKGNFLQVRHEDLVSRTKGTINNLQNFLEVDCHELAEHVANGGELQQSHNVGGNRLRMQKAIKISPTTDLWHENLSKTKAVLVTIAIIPLRLIYYFLLSTKRPLANSAKKSPQ